MLANLREILPNEIPLAPLRVSSPSYRVAAGALIPSYKDRFGRYSMSIIVDIE